jgi:hypothetical protein
VSKRGPKLGQVPNRSRGRSENTKELIVYARRLLFEDHPQTLRQLHYAIFSRKEIDYDNDQRSYKRLSRATSYARRLYRQWDLGKFTSEQFKSLDVGTLAIQPDWMVDETRQPEEVYAFDNLDEYIEHVRYSYRRNAWQTQDEYVEVWSEKATILGAIRPVADELGITLRVSHGYGSTGMENQIGEFFAGKDEAGKRIVVFYLGDHDPDGHVIEEDLRTRVKKAGVWFHMERLAIHQSDIRDFDLPPQKIKATSSRASGFRKRFGKNAATVELDALPAAELRRRVRDAINPLIDRELWDQQHVTQAAEEESIERFANIVKNLPQVSPEAGQP